MCLLHFILQGAGQQKRRLCTLNYYISSNTEPMGVTNCAHPANELLPETLQPCGYTCPSSGPPRRDGEAIGCCVSPGLALCQGAAPCGEQVQPWQTAKTCCCPAAQTSGGVLPSVKHLMQPALPQRNVAAALALRLGMSHHLAHLCHLFLQHGGRLGPM